MIGSHAFRAMMAAGLSQEQMLSIIEGIEVDKRPRDATNAERQARHRAKKSNAVTVTPEPPIESIHTPSGLSDDKPSKARKRAVSAQVEIPDWIPAKPWADFLAMRIEIKKPVTPTGLSKVIEKLNQIRQAGWDLAKVLDKTTMNQWRGVFEPTPGRDDDMRAQAAGKPGAAMTELDRRKVELFSQHRDGEFDEREYRRRKAELEQQFEQPPPARHGTTKSFGSLIQNFAQAPPQ